jgi:hypothetical protein
MAGFSLGRTTMRLNKKAQGLQFKILIGILVAIVVMIILIALSQRGIVSVQSIFQEQAIEQIK